MADYDQTGRLMTFTSTAGDGALLLYGLRGREQLNQPFRYELELVGFNLSLDIKGLLGQQATVKLRLADDTYRPIHGHISRISRVGRTQEGLVLYRAELVPWLWFLSLTRDCRIFQNLTVQKIVETVFSDAGFSDFELRSVTGGNTTRLYCVQYQETALDFVSRLIEEEGIYYFFEHAEDRHTLVLADAPVQHPSCPGQPKARVHADSSAVLHDADVVTSLSLSTVLNTGKVAMGDYDFEQAGVDLTVALAGDGEYESYEYPGGYIARDAGETLARIRLEALAAAAVRIEGTSVCRALSAGFQLELEDYDASDIESPLVITGVEHEARQPLGLAGIGGSAHYANRFTALPHSVPYRPPRRTPRPRVYGAQTAKVVGKKGEEIWTDKHGRIKVQFHWDRVGAKDENSSCWVRVATAVAGKQWGSFSLPRIGQEVVVEFLDGDPDRPLVVGSVYNSEMAPPYALPDEQTKSTFKSSQSPGGAAFNELRIEDRKDEEEVYLHAAKDFKEEILNDSSTLIKHDQLVAIENERKVSLKKDDTLVIEGKATHTITGDVVSKVKSGAVNLTLDSGDLTVKAAKGAMALDASSKDITLKAKEITLNATSAVTIKVGSNSVTIDSSTIVLAQGSNKVSLDSNGVTIAGAPKITIG